jgi:SNF2 family DNA or RNA helicase
MLKISDEADDQLSIGYADSALDKDTRNLVILTRLLKGKLEAGSKKIIFSTSDSHQSILTIQKLLDKAHIQEKIVSQGAIKEVLEKAQNEHANFAEFSLKAKDIRNNHYSVDDFKEFESTTHSLSRVLKPFQLLAAYHLAFSQNAGNFSVPGSGKTTTVLAAYNYLSQLPAAAPKHVGRILVVSPLAAFKAWKDEFKACFDRMPEYLEVYGGSIYSKQEIKSRLLTSENTHELILISYQSLATYEEEVAHFLRTNPTMMVLDEAHRIKKVDNGLWAETVLRIASFAKSRVVLTGTPAPNGYIDLRNLFKFMWPDKNVIGYSNVQLKQMTDLDSNDHRVLDLIERISPFFIRVNKQDLKLPKPQFHSPQEVEMGPVQARIYEAIENLYLPSLSANHQANIGLFKSRLIRLRQAASNPMLLTLSLAKYYEDYDTEASLEHYELVDDLGVSNDIMKLIQGYNTSNEVPSKFIAAKQLVSKILEQRGKVIIWCEFVKNLQGLGEYLEKNSIHVQYMYGAVSKDERERIIDEIHSAHSSFKVILANPHAVGESISLHKACHYAIYFEMSYNAASYMQSKDRIHRVGLPPDAETQYYFLNSRNTIDDNIYKRVIQKEKKMLDIIEGQEIPLIVNNADFMDDDADDLKSLLRDYYERHGLV